jgi:hypothetical protein
MGERDPMTVPVREQDGLGARAPSRNTRTPGQRFRAHAIRPTRRRPKLEKGDVDGRRERTRRRRSPPEWRQRERDGTARVTARAPGWRGW